MNYLNLLFCLSFKIKKKLIISQITEIFESDSLDNSSKEFLIKTFNLCKKKMF